MQRTICDFSRSCRNATRQFPLICRTSFGSELELKLQTPKQCRNASVHLAIAHRTTSHFAKARGEHSPDEDLLSQCRWYNINSIQDLDRESDLDRTTVGSKRLVDTAPLRADLRLWDILLDYRIRYYGSEGARTIWKALKGRGPTVSLESEDALTTRVWQKLLSCAAEHDDLKLTQRLCEHDGIAWRRPRLFAETISTLLRSGRNHQVEVMCKQLSSKHSNGIADVLELYRTFQPMNHEDLKAFCSVYEKLRPGKMYRQGVLQLLNEQRMEDALLLHKFLTSRGDFPGSFQEIEPFMKYLAKRAEDPGPFLRSLAASGVMFKGQGRRAYEHESQVLRKQTQHSSYRSDSVPERPRANKISDSFAAKAFTTRALSFDFVLNALQAFGLTEVGPQSLREIGLHSSTMEIFTQRLAKLDELGIDTGGSAYSRFIRKSCQAKQYPLLLHALRTDMHHDVFEDVYLQTHLLVESLQRCDWNKVNLLLAMLNSGQYVRLEGSVTSSLLASIIDDDSKARTFLTLLSNVSKMDVRIPGHLLHDVVDHLLSRLRGFRMVDHVSRGNFCKRAQLTAAIMQGCATAGSELMTSQWWSIFSQLGKAGALDDVRKLATWLAVWYMERVEDNSFNKEPAEDALDDLARMFGEKFQRAIVHWTLKEQFARHSGVARGSWQRTLTLLRYLRDECAIPLKMWTIRRTIVLYVRGLRHRAMPSSRIQGVDTRLSNDSRRMCLRLFRTLHESLRRQSGTTKLEVDEASALLMGQEPLRTREAMIPARPSLRKVMTRLPYPWTFVS